MNKKVFSFVAFIWIVAVSSYVISSSGGKTGRTQSGCTCHGELSAGNASISLTANPDIFSTGYTAGSNYTLTVALSGGPVGSNGGFDLSASAGTFSDPGQNTQIIGGEVTHSSPGARNWTVKWTAPDVSVQSVTFFFAGNATDGNGNTAGDDPTPAAQLTAQIKASSVAEGSQISPNSFEVFQSYPNPFNSTTQIKYRIDRPGTVKLTIFSLSGKAIYKSMRYHQKAGIFQVRWNGKLQNGRDAASGLYFYKLEFKGASQIRKLFLVK